MQLQIYKRPNGDVTLRWGDSCVLDDNDYEIYEGTVGDFTSHAAKACTTNENKFSTITPATGNRCCVTSVAIFTMSKSRKIPKPYRESSGPRPFRVTGPLEDRGRGSI